MRINPIVQTLDTDFSKGKLVHTQEISLNDTAKFHGHLCDGLVLGFLGLKEVLFLLYPDGTIDRTNTQIVSKSSPCLTDVAVYLTGGRYQFNTFYVDDDIEYAYILKRIDNYEQTYGVKLKAGIKPSIIDELGKKAVQQKLSAEDLERLKKMEDDFSNFLLNANSTDLFLIEPINDFKWHPRLENQFIKTDIINKHIHYSEI